MTPKSDDLVDPRIAEAWRETSSEEPAASVDAAILAAARREVSARPEALVDWQAREARASRRRWWPLAAAATVAAIAVGVLQLTPTDKLVSPASETATVSDVPAPAGKIDTGVGAPPAAKTESAAPVPTPAVEPNPPAPPPAAPPPAASAPAPFPAAKPAPPRKEQQRDRSDDARPKAEAQSIAPPPSSAPPAAPTAAPPPAEPRQSATAPSPNPFPAANKVAADAAAPTAQAAPSPPPAPQRSEAAGGVPREGDSVARPAAAPAAAPAPLAKMAGRADERANDDARAKDRKPLPVPDWIALIRRLRAEGKQDEAAKELVAFRAAHPDHEKLLPPDLRDWRPPEK